MQVKFDVTEAEGVLISRIADRAMVFARAYGIDYPYRDCLMDLTATHANGCPLKLGQLLDADQMNFTHDVFGIRNHIDRRTGQLNDCFCPRFAA